MPLFDDLNPLNMPHDAPLDDSAEKRRRTLPKFLSADEGRRQVSFAALVERVVDQCYAEHSPDNTRLRLTDTRTERLKLLLPVVDYVVNMQSVALTTDSRAQLIRAVYAEVFAFGPLEALIDDLELTTITIEGADKISVRRGHGELEALSPIFENESHLKDIAGRLFLRAKAQLREEMPLVEIGCRADNGRFISVSVAAPPATVALNLDIRLHPLQPPTLDGLLQHGTLDAPTLQLLRALIRSEYGLVVAGQPESGKTMTLAALLAELPNPEQAVAVQRTGEMPLPAGMQSVVAEWMFDGENPPKTFGDQIHAQIEAGVSVLVLDEVRADEPESIAPLLESDAPPRLIWSFRGAPDEKRMRAALGMLARRAVLGAGEGAVRRIFERLPFVISMRRLNGKLEVREVGEWYYPDRAEIPEYQALVQLIDGEGEFVGNAPQHPIAEWESIIKQS